MTPTDVLAAILYQEPPNLLDHPAGITRELERIVHRCLEKDPAKRYSSANELWREMQDLEQGITATGTPAKPAFSQSLDKTAAGFKWRSSLWALPILAGLTLLVALIFLVLRRKPADAAFDTMTIARVATRGESTGAAISEDGKYVAYVLRDEIGESIWTTQLATGTDVRVIAPEHGEHVSLKFSPDGNYLYYRLNTSDGAHDLYRVSDLGGAPLKLMGNVPGSIAFAPDGKHLGLSQSIPRGSRPHSLSPTSTAAEPISCVRVAIRNTTREMALRGLPTALRLPASLESRRASAHRRSA